jgi:hypothetical protein
MSSMAASNALGSNVFNMFIGLGLVGRAAFAPPLPCVRLLRLIAKALTLTHTCSHTHFLSHLLTLTHTRSHTDARSYAHTHLQPWFLYLCIAYPDSKHFVLVNNDELFGPSISMLLSVGSVFVCICFVHLCRICLCVSVCVFVCLFVCLCVYVSVI